MVPDPPSPARTQLAAPEQRSRKAARALIALSVIVVVLITAAWVAALFLFARWLIGAAV